MKRINFLLIVLSLFIYTSCEQEDYEFGDILSPTNLTISAAVQGADADIPMEMVVAMLHLLLPLQMLSLTNSFKME